MHTRGVVNLSRRLCEMVSLSSTVAPNAGEKIRKMFTEPLRQANVVHWDGVMDSKIQCDVQFYGWGGQ